MKLLDNLVDLNLIEKKDTDLYEYSISIIKSYFFFCITVIAINIFFTHNYFLTIFYLLLLFNLRRFCGGFHFESKELCYIFSVAITIIIPEYAKKISVSLILLIIIQLLCSILILFLPIIDNPHKFISAERKKKYSLILKKHLVLYFFCTSLLSFFNEIEIVNIIFLTILITLISSILGYFKYYVNN